jgi:EAL domain-containing protein (putative c-di-GMP-specific phosphodiesterase class I)
MHTVTRRALGDRDRFVAFAFAAADLLVEVGADGRVGFAAGAFRARLGRTPESLIGRDPGEVLAPEDRAAFATALALLPPHGRLAPTAFRLADAKRTAFSVSGLRLLSADDPARLCLAFAPLPSPPDFRAATAETLVREVEQRLMQGESGSLALIEAHGVDPDSTAGIDALLTREVGGSGLAARIAPGRYGLLTEAATLPSELVQLAGRLESALGEAAPGVSVAATAMPLSAEALSPVQSALALRHGLGAFARLGAEGLRDAGFEDGLCGVVARVTARAAALRRVIAERRFRLAFQPIVQLETREIHHYEALLRPEPGVLAPGEGPQDFVTLAETVGLTEELDLAVATLALAAVPAAPKGRRIAFNISGLSAQSPGFRSRLMATLDRDGRGAAGVMVELTESAAVEDEEAAAVTLRALRARGVPVCIDDFGAGAAAFRYLKAFPTDYVKVDGAFVLAAMTSERDRSFVAAMVDLSLAVGAKVVAERVEDEAAARAMQELGVHFGQGWFFGRPGSL